MGSKGISRSYQTTLRPALRALKRRYVVTNDLVALYRLRQRGFLQRMGWLSSCQRNLPVDQHGNPLPWYTYASIKFLEKRIDATMDVFEFGCGYSTLWWAERVSSVTACEHDRDWYLRIKNELPDNVTLSYVELVPDGEYANFARTRDKKFDIIVIDGRDRVNCAKRSVEALKPEGVIVLDDSDYYQESCDFLCSIGFRRVDFIGMRPNSIESPETSIFYRDDNCLRL